LRVAGNDTACLPEAAPTPAHDNRRWRRPPPAIQGINENFRYRYANADQSTGPET
jgi:hypothetical protein